MLSPDFGATLLLILRLLTLRLVLLIYGHSEYIYSCKYLLGLNLNIICNVDGNPLDLSGALVYDRGP